MAITINTSPSSINAAYSEIKWNVSSNDVDIKAIRCDLYVNGSYSTTVDAVQQLGSTSIFNVDVRKIVQSVLVSELRSNITTFQITECTTSAASIKMRFHEIILSGGVFTTTWAANGGGGGYVESGTVKVVNISLQEDEVLSSFTVEDATKKLLTLRTGGERIPRNVPFQLGFISTDAVKSKYTTYNSSLVQIATNNSSVVTSTHGKGIIEIPISLFSGSNVAFIDVQLLNAFNDPYSEVIRFKVEDYCALFPIFIQNHLGCFDHFNFGAKKLIKINTSNQSLKRDSGNITVNSNVNEKTQVFTEGLSAKELTFMQEFVKNKSVAHYWKNANNFKRLRITSHSTKLVDTDKFINQVALTLETSSEWKVQKGD